MDNKRYGRFSIDRRFIEDDPDKISNMFSELKIIVLRAEMLYHKDAIEYIAYSPFFDMVPDGYIPTEYNIIVHKNIDEETKEVTYQYKLEKYENIKQPAS